MHYKRLVEIARVRPRRRVIAAVVAVAVGAVLVVAAQPFAAELLARWEVQRAHDSLTLPVGWSALGPPVTQVPRRGFVLLSAAYRRPGDGSANLTAFREFETAQGWRVIGGAPDLSTAILQRNDLSLAAAVIQGAGVVRVELSRTVDTWW